MASRNTFDKKRTALIIVGFLLLAYSAYVTPLLLSGTADESLFASASKGISGVLNVYTRPAEDYLHIDAPFFSFLPLDKALFNPKSIIQSLTKTLFPGTNTKTGTAQAPASASVTLPQTTENTLVNIFCSQKLSGNLRKTVTGSGVLINSDGTVLTNAHVAEYPLVADTKSAVVCLARSGSPASHSYNVHVEFISPEWIRTNGQNISAGGTPETGQSDFALLKISNPDGSPLNLRTSPISLTNGATGSPVNAVSYPAEVLGTKGVNAALYVQKDMVSISSQYMLSGAAVNDGKADIIETTPSTIGQVGSSGGALTDLKGNLVALITMTTGSGTDKKAIRGLTLSSIQNDVDAYHQGGLLDIIQNGSGSLQTDFNSQYRADLTSLLSGYLSL